MDKEFEEFIEAVQDGDVEAVRDRLRPEFVDRRDDEYSITPLMWASLNGHLTVVEVLLTLKDWLGWSCLHCAAQWGHADVVAHFIEIGVDLGARDWRGRTALDLARKGKKVDCVKMLEAAAEKQKKQKKMLEAAAEHQKKILECGRGDDVESFKELFPSNYLNFRDPQRGIVEFQKGQRQPMSEFESVFNGLSRVAVVAGFALAGIALCKYVVDRI